MAKRYALRDSSWEMIKDLIAQDQKTGRHETMPNGNLWGLCSGGAWRGPLVDGLPAFLRLAKARYVWAEAQTLECPPQRARIDRSGHLDHRFHGSSRTRASAGTGKKWSLKNRYCCPCSGPQSRRLPPRFTCSAMRRNHPLCFICRADKPAIISPVQSLGAGSKYPAQRRRVLANAAAGGWRIRATTANTFGAATAIGMQSGDSIATPAA